MQWPYFKPCTPASYFGRERKSKPARFVSRSVTSRPPLIFAACFWDRANSARPYMAATNKHWLEDYHGGKQSSLQRLAFLCWKLTLRSTGHRIYKRNFLTNRPQREVHCELQTLLTVWVEAISSREAQVGQWSGHQVTEISGHVGPAHASNDPVLWHVININVFETTWVLAFSLARFEREARREFVLVKAT